MTGARSLVAVLLVLGFCAPSWAQEAESSIRSDEVVSPQLRSLRAALSAGSHDAVDEFWTSVALRGTPLIEDIAGDTENLLVTFLWRNTEPLAGVFLLSGLTNWKRTSLTRLSDTDVWYHTFRVRTDARFTYSMAELRGSIDDMQWQVDPGNPAVVDWPERESLVELPRARPQPWIMPRPEVPSGTLTQHRLSSTILQNERNMSVYTPPGYNGGGAAYPVVVFFDGDIYLNFIPTPTILDNLIAEELIPPTIAVFVEHPTREARTRELGCYPPFNEFLISELLPWMRRNYEVTQDPGRTVAAGLSRGGLAAAFLALQHPETFGNVLSQSGGFWYKPPWERGQAQLWHADNDTTGYGWLMRRYVATPLQAIRFYLDVGRFEQGLGQANRHMRDVLMAKGYSVAYQEFSGGHSSINWRGTVSDGLIALLREAEQMANRN